ncbi:hypothetical protein BH20ACT5_BH20ACT5_08920 [soil metagenome]
MLAGHRHEQDFERVEDTVIRTEGSTGGAGLRGLQGEAPTPLTCTVLYFDRFAGQLEAYDEVRLGRLGQTEVTIVRNVVEVPVPASAPD